MFYGKLHLTSHLNFLSNRCVLHIALDLPEKGHAVLVACVPGGYTVNQSLETVYVDVG